MAGKIMNEFKTYHPIVNFTYFVAVISFSMFLMHPIALIISLVCSFAYSVVTNGAKAVRFNFIWLLPLAIVTAILNPIFNHEGVTILTYLPGGNPLTLESILFGIAAAAMLSSVVLWFSCFNKIMTSDKLVYLFGRITPALSLVFSMALRFVPRLKSDLKEIVAAQKGIGKDLSHGSISVRLKNALSVLSILVTRTLEGAIETADSMKSRGYGIGRRTAFSVFRFDKRDATVLAVISLLTAYIIFGRIHFSYYPYLTRTPLTAYDISLFAAYLILCTVPIAIEAKEALTWKAIKSKI